MYLGLFLLLLVLIGAVVRHLLYKTRLPGWAVLLITLLISTAATILLYWAAIFLSVLAFQINDPITW